MTKHGWPATGVGGSASIVGAGVSSAASVRTGVSWEDAVAAALDDLDEVEAPDLALVFVDSRFFPHYADVLGAVAERLEARHVIGCSGQGVIGPAWEAEDAPGISVMALRLPGAELRTAALLPSTDAGAEVERLLQDDPSAVFVFADPFSVQVEHLIAALEQRQEGLSVLGGFASAHNGAEGTVVFLDGTVHEVGAVLLSIGGDLQVRTLVAQGAEPLGEPWTITDAEKNIVRAIGNRPAVDVLRETLEALDPAMLDRAQRNLLVGIAIDEYRDTFGRGDYLVRNLLGFDEDTGSVAVNAMVRVGQTLQFQFRDAAAADDDLRGQLEALPVALEGRQAVGALLCTCNGRGQGLFGEPHHDANAVAAALGDLPLVGLFCGGEIGPVGGQAFLHGFTASIGVMTLPERSESD